MLLVVPSFGFWVLGFRGACKGKRVCSSAGGGGGLAMYSSGFLNHFRSCGAYNSESRNGKGRHLSLSTRRLRRVPTQRAQYPLIKDYTLNHNMKAPLI